MGKPTSPRWCILPLAIAVLYLVARSDVAPLVVVIVLPACAGSWLAWKAAGRLGRYISGED